MSDLEHLTTDWRNLYGESWKGLITDEAFAHPAKFSRALIAKIYQHLLDEELIQPGDTVLDPFGGVALGGFNAMRLGLHWVGMELEEKFHTLGNGNIDLWEKQYPWFPEAYPPHLSARLIQQDEVLQVRSLSSATTR